MGRRETALLVGAGVATVTAFATVRIIRRRRKRHVLPRRVRRAVTEVLEMRGQDFLAEGSMGESLFRRRIGKLDDRQLVMVFALAQLGHLAREWGVDPLHPSTEQVARALDALAQARRGTPLERDDMMGQLESEAPGSLKEALSVALGLLSHAT